MDDKVFARPEEAREYALLLAEARDLDARRRKVTARLNVLRQRFAQRRLADKRGNPFRRVLAKPTPCGSAECRPTCRRLHDSGEPCRPAVDAGRVADMVLWQQEQEAAREP